MRLQAAKQKQLTGREALQWMAPHMTQPEAHVCLVSCRLECLPYCGNAGHPVTYEQETRLWQPA